MVPLSPAVLAMALTVLVGSAPDSPPGAGVSYRSERIPVAQATPGPLVAYEVRLARVDGTSMRGQFDVRMRPLQRWGGATVWAADEPTVRELIERMQASPRFNLVSAPRIIAPLGDGVRLLEERWVRYVAHLDRIADGPPQQANHVAFHPATDELRDGVRAELSQGRLTNEGLQTRLTVDLQRLVGVSSASFTEVMHPRQPETKAGNAVVQRLERLVKKDATPRLAAITQVPLVQAARVEGEFIIPKTGVLVVGMGPRLIWGARGARETEEDVVLIRYVLAPGETPTPVVPAATATTSRRLTPTAN